MKNLVLPFSKQPIVALVLHSCVCIRHKVSCTCQFETREIIEMQESEICFGDGRKEVGGGVAKGY